MKTAKCAAAMIDILSTALNITVTLGLPEIGRTKIALPTGALQFREDAYGVQRAKRLGEVPAAGFADRFVGYVLAKNEAQLLSYVDALRDLKATCSSVTLDSKPYIVRWSETRRSEIIEGAAEFDFCIEFDVIVSQS